MSFAFKTDMADRNSNLTSVAVILAGGSGTRFWPSSRKKQPKQYLNFFGATSLIQNTASRIEPFTGKTNLYVCSTESQRSLLEKQLPGLNAKEQFIMEPQGKNTAPCIALCVLHMLRLGLSPQTIMVVLPADHFIGDEAAFLTCIEEAKDLALAEKGLVTLGIIPTVPHTGYGYIEGGEKLNGGDLPRFKIKQFVEKPDRGRAEKFLMSGKFYWNAGIFVWTLASIQEAFRAHMPELWTALEHAFAENDPAKFADVYRKVPSVAVDVGIMEKAKNSYVIPASIRWSDVGSWDAVYQLNSSSGAENVILEGNVLSMESKACLVKVPKDKKVALIGVEGLVVIDEGDGLLVCRRESDQLVRKAADRFDP